MKVLLPEQVDALRELQQICQEIGVDLILIGAIACRVWLVDEDRQTEDIDAAVALDLEAFPRLTERLTARGWRQDPRWEQRWHAPQKARVDLLPIGPKARREKRILWPRADMQMSVVGYDHIFQDAVERELAPALEIRVAPLVVLALTKIVSYLDDPHRRQKDLQDLIVLMHKYEEVGDRRFSDEVLDAHVEYEEAGAYLLGRDLRALCSTEDERHTVERFLDHVGHPDFQVPATLSRMAGIGAENSDLPFARDVAALEGGFYSAS